MGDLIGLVAVSAPFIMVVGLVWIKNQGKIAESRVGLTAEKAAQYATHTTQLEDRVRVLERIVTEKGYDVATQIEALRDARQTEARLDAPQRETQP